MMRRLMVAALVLFCVQASAYAVEAPSRFEISALWDDHGKIHHHSLALDGKSSIVNRNSSFLCSQPDRIPKEKIIRPMSVEMKRHLRRFNRISSRFEHRKGRPSRVISTHPHQVKFYFGPFEVTRDRTLAPMLRHALEDSCG